MFALRMAALTLLSFLLPQTTILGGISPFAGALIAALPAQYALIGAVGALVGFLAGGLDANAMMYLCIIAVIIAVKLLWKKHHLVNQMMFCAALCLFSFIGVHIIAGRMFGFLQDDFWWRICESVLACGITCFVHIAFHTLLREKPTAPYNQVEVSSIGIMLMLGVIALSSIQLYEFNVGVIFGILCLYILIHRLGLVGGTIGSMALSFALCLHSLTFLPLCVILIVACFITGMFYPLGKFVHVGVFTTTAIFGVFIVGVNLFLLFSVIEILMASGLYLSLSEKTLHRIKLMGSVKQSAEGDITIKTAVESRLEFAAETIQDLKNSLQVVSQKLNGMEHSDVSEIYNQTASSVCQSCGLKLICWDEQYNDTVEALQKLTKKIKQHGVITANDIKQNPHLDCCREAALAHTLQQNYHGYQSKQKVDRYVREIRELAAEQFTGVAQMLWEVSEEIGDIKATEPDTAQIISQVVTDLAAKPESVACIINRFDRMEIEIHASSAVQMDPKELTQALSRALKRDFAPPSISQVQNKMRISLYEKPTYLLDYGAYQMSNKQQSICGDSYEYFIDNKGHAYVIISDGMGSGGEAALDSTMTCGVILKLIKAGFGMDSVIKFVNSCLQVKSNNESLSTIDVARVDLFTGQAEFFKAGCACSYLMMGASVAKVETQSLPIGILQGVQFDHKAYLLHDGDTIIMMSDGVMELGDQEIAHTLKQYSQLSCQALSKRLCIKAAGTLGQHDDLTVVVARMSKGI